MPCHTPPNTVHAETQAKWAAGRGEKAGAPGGEWPRVWAVLPVRETVAGSTAQRSSSCGGRGVSHTHAQNMGPCVTVLGLQSSSPKQDLLLGPEMPKSETGEE